MIEIVRYTSEKKEIWNDFVKKSKNGIFMFDRNFMDYHADRFYDNSLMFFDDGELIAILPMSLHGNELRSHGGLTYGGFITNEKMKQHKMNKCFELLKEYMKDNNISKLIYKVLPHIYHKQPAEEDIYSLYKYNAKIYKVEPSTLVLLKNPLKMPKGRKAQISRAKRDGVTTEKSYDFEKFIRLENAVLSEHHNTTAVHTAPELRLLQSRFPNNIELLVAKYNNEVIAGSLLFMYDNVIHTQYMAANDKAREIGALDLLVKNIMDMYSDTNVFLDFGISSENNGTFLNEGLISQKEGFGGRTAVYQTWEINIATFNGEENEL